MKSNIFKKTGAIHAFGSLFINANSTIYIQLLKLKENFVRKIDWFYVPQEFFTLYGDVTIAG